MLLSSRHYQSEYVSARVNARVRVHARVVCPCNICELSSSGNYRRTIGGDDRTRQIRADLSGVARTAEGGRGPRRPRTGSSRRTPSEARGLWFMGFAAIFPRFNRNAGMVARDKSRGGESNENRINM